MNIPGDTKFAHAAIDYEAPVEQAPGQRFAFFLFKQPFFLGVPQQGTVQRQRFDLRYFYRMQGLGNPIRVLWFTSP